MVKPTRTNRITFVKSAFPRVFNPTSSSSSQLNFIKNKNECFQYGYNLTKNIKFSFCLTCNSSYQCLSSKSSKLSDKSNLMGEIRNTGIKEMEKTGRIDTIKVI